MKALTTLGLVFLFAGAAHAQFGEIVRPPSAPTELAPATGTWQGSHGHGTPLVLGWTQLILPPGGLDINPPATHFLVCIDSYAPGATPPACNLANRDYIETVASPSPALTRNVHRFTFMPGRFVEDAELDQPLRVSVVACSALVDRGCRATSADLWYSSMNILSDAASESANTTKKSWKLDVRAMNTGDGMVPAFSGTLQLFEVLSTGNPGRDCLKDPSMLGMQPDLVILDKLGGMTPLPMAQLPWTGPAIVGIFRQGSFSDSKSFTTTDPAFAGAQSTSRGIKELEFLIPQSAVTQRTFVVRATLDTGNVIREFNELDNIGAACRKR